MLTFPVDPMRAVLGSLPGDDERWAYEIKYDGFRTLAFVQDGRVRLQSSSMREVTDRYPELAGLAADVHAGTAILDGELVVLDDEGRPRFELIQRHDRPAVLFVFDVLRIDEHDTVDLPYEDRRHLLAQLVEPGDHWAVPSHRVGGGTELLVASGERDLEGIMAKRLGSRYLPGRRSADWRKIKHRRRVELVIGGFTTGAGNRADTFGALLVGRRAESGDLVFAGGVGTGFDQRRLDALSDRLHGLATDDCPFAPPPPKAYGRVATWVRPELVAVVEITEFTDEGLVRQASFVGLAEERP